MTFSVVFGNYYPREVDSRWLTKAGADGRANELNGVNGGMWEVEETRDEVSARLEAMAKCLRAIDDRARRYGDEDEIYYLVPKSLVREARDLSLWTT